MKKRVLLGLVMGACLVGGNLAGVSHWSNYNAGLSDEEALARALDRSADGFEEEELQRAIYESLQDYRPSASTERSDSTQEQCSICMEKYSANTQITRLPCGHSFCTGCINRWLEVNNTCPLCRKAPRSSNSTPNVSKTRTVTVLPEPSHDIDTDLAIAQLLDEIERDDDVVRRDYERRCTSPARVYRRRVEKPGFLQKVRNFLGL